MDRSGPGVDWLLADLSPGVLQARLLARRLDRIVQEMGEGISGALYRRTRDAVVRGNHEFILADPDNDRVLRELLRQETPVAASGPPRPDIGLPGDPRRLREVWEDLSSSDRAELFHLDPFLGNRDGIPTADRDIYTRRALDGLLERARGANDHTRAAAYAKIKRMLDDPGLYLTYIDNDGGLAFSRGNPDFSRNTAVLLQPAQRPHRVLNYASSTVEQFHQLALRTAPNSGTAVSYWGVYNQPHSMLQAMFPQFAQDGAARVRDYHEGLRATHEGPSAHITTIGHSYGSVLAGHSAGYGETLNTDAVVSMGSWGMGADHVGELSLTGVSPERTGERVFSTISPTDFVQLMPDTHGRLPTDRDFDATVFASTPRFAGQWNPVDHSMEAYLHSGNPASGNIGLIITGYGDLVA